MAVLFLMIVLALAQSISGDPVGTIADPSGAGVPVATITAANIATGTAATAHVTLQIGETSTVVEGFGPSVGGQRPRNDNQKEAK